jgi:hypothetical protein
VTTDQMRNELLALWAVAEAARDWLHGKGSVMALSKAVDAYEALRPKSRPRKAQA